MRIYTLSYNNDNDEQEYYNGSKVKHCVKDVP